MTLQNGKEVKIKKRVDYNKSDLDSFVEVVWTSELRTAFIIQLLARLFIEVIFFFLLFLIQTEQNHSWNVSDNLSVQFCQFLWYLVFFCMEGTTYVCLRSWSNG